MTVDEPDGGFTLIELLVVIIIIGILASIAVPVFLNQRRKGYDAQVKADLHNVALEQEALLAETGSYAQTIINGPVPSSPVAGAVYYLKSPNASLVTAEFVSAAGNLVGATSATGYCISSTSTSGRTFSYLSTNGTLTLGNQCP